MRYIKLYENYLDDLFKQQEEKKKGLPDPIANKEFDETYKVVAEQIFYEIDDKFRHDMNQFFPLKVTLEEYKGHYDLTIALALGWITRMSDDDIEWMSDRVYDLNKQFEKDNNFYVAFMGDSSGRGGARKLFNMQNEDFPKESNDYLQFPEGRYPDRG